MRNFLLMIAFAGLTFLGACGIKPGNVEPPGGENAPEFPQTYPRPDPQY